MRDLRQAPGAAGNHHHPIDRVGAAGDAGADVRVQQINRFRSPPARQARRDAGALGNVKAQLLPQHLKPAAGNHQVYLAHARVGFEHLERPLSEQRAARSGDAHHNTLLRGHSLYRPRWVTVRRFFLGGKPFGSIDAMLDGASGEVKKVRTTACA